MSVPIRRFVNVNVAFADFIDGESVGNESIDTSGNLYEWRGPALGWVQTHSGGAVLVSPVDPRGAFPPDQYVETTHTLAGGGSLDVSGMAGYKLAVIVAVETTAGDTTGVTLRGVIAGQQTAPLGGAPVNGGADTTSFSTVGYRVDLGYETLRYEADGTTGEWTIYAIYHKTGSTAYLGT